MERKNSENDATRRDFPDPAIPTTNMTNIVVRLPRDSDSRSFEICLGGHLKYDHRQNTGHMEVGFPFRDTSSLGLDVEQAARDPDSTVMKILYLACQSLRPAETIWSGSSCAFP